jgi:murein DD-endopeptidase MepM/ murein hydrolase activator NlpD
MRNTARLALAIVVVTAAMLVLPRPASRVLTPDANAQVQTPTIPDLLGSPKPEPSSSEEPIPDPGSGGGGGGGSGGGGGGKDPNGSGKGGGKGGASDGSKDGRGPGGRNGRSGPKGRGGPKRGSKGGGAFTPPASIAGRIPGAYDTAALVAVAARLRSLGMSAEEVTAKVYPPFIIAGRASWIDTWHAPRYGPAPGQVRVHEGQDVFCDYGDPVLAPTDGWVDFSNSGLGGITARVHEGTGRYWYLTHLSDINHDLSIGQPVTVGTIVGYCGNSGNAATTAPHVHFGWYAEGGVDVRNPMRHLIDWLHEAERRVLGVVVKADRQRQRQYESGVLTTARRFGDAFAPDRSELRIAGASLWASGGSPASGAFGLAEAALQEALSSNGLELGLIPQPVDLTLPQANTNPGLDPESKLAKILEEASHTTGSENAD